MLKNVNSNPKRRYQQNDPTVCGISRSLKQNFFFWNIQNSPCFALWIPQDVAQYLSIIDYRVSSFKRLKIMFLCNFKIMMFLIVKIFMTYIEFGFFLIQLFSFLFTDLQRRNLSTNEQSLRWHSWLSWSGACCPFACCKHNQGQISIHLFFTL